MFEITKPTCDADIKNIEQEIVRLNNVILDYNKEQFNKLIVSRKQSLVVPRSAMVKKSTSYEFGSRGISFFQSHYDYFGPEYYEEDFPDYSLDSNRTFPILESWKTYKASKSTCYILYDTVRDYFLYVCIKDVELGSSIVERS